MTGGQVATTKASRGAGAYAADNAKIVIERSLLMAVGANTRHSKDMCDLVIEPHGLDKYSAFDIGKAKEIFDLGYKFTRENLKPAQLQRILD